jgi:hypothetical protein
VFRFVKYFIRQMSRAFSGLGETSANVGHGIAVAGDFLERGCVEQYGLGFVIHSRH